jgi:hypothetical protein
MDNFYKDCPPMMSDGRLFTDYRTAVRADETNKYINGIVRDDEYRMFLQNNAQAIMENTWEYNKKTKSCWQNECVHNYPTRVYPPWFVEERKAYNQLSLPGNKRTSVYKCPHFKDYKISGNKIRPHTPYNAQNEQYIMQYNRKLEGQK